ncbi:hypothetical protein GE061_015499 [Apolygus lucorum]|uniref:Polycystin cation channel PKD1/PKD2 domain-containing protein n=1 Tax=Apolygus lucorum TaxID=248454 RepID=A0A8S9XL62_APOLU|nr:hypothetical protein GE061_015499 [Apolygus lucorum]
MRGEDEMADDYGLRRRFTDKEYDLMPIEQLVFSDDTTSETTGETDAIEDASETETGGGGYLRKGAQMGAISRKILQPEYPDRDQPHKMKKDKNKKEPADDKGKPRKDKSESRQRSATPDNQETYVENAMRDFVLYLIFLVIANMITFGVLDHAYNYYANTLSEIITKTQFPTDLGVSKDFNQIRNVPQIWDFIRLILLKTMYEYGTDHAKTIRAGKKDDILVLFENILIGLPRIRQQRVKNDSCSVQAMFKDLFPSCYDYYSDSEEDKEPFGMKNPTAWTYAPPDGDSSSYTGKISSYGGGGYMMNLTTNKIYTASWINELINHAWIQQGTRVVFIDFTTYTPNTNLFCVVKLVFELPPTGGVIPTAHFYTMKFLRYVNTWDHFVLGCEIIFLCYIVYFTMEEFQQMISLKEEYWYSSWNILDLCILLVAYFVIISASIRYVTIATGMKAKVDNIRTSSHASFDNFVRVQRTFNTAAALLSFLVWLKLLKFAALNKSVALILSIFGRVKFELIALTLMMFTVVVGFALLGNMLFGTHVEQFNTIWNSIFSLVGIFVGGLYFYMDCADISPVLAPIFFVLYIFIVLILFLNAYVALIVHGFHKAVEEFDDQRNRIYLGDICRTIMYKILKLVRKGALANKLKDKANTKENKKDYEDLSKIVKKHGYRGLDLSMLFKKYNITPGSPLPVDKMSQLYNEIDAKNQLFLEVDEHDKIMDQVELIGKKVASLDQSMSEVMEKVDKLVAQLLYAEDKL